MSTRKNWRRFLALLMVCAMMLSMAACGSKDTQDPTTGAKQEVSSNEAQASSLNLGGVRPIVPEGEERSLSLMVIQWVTTGEYEDKWMYHYIQECLNINLDVTVVTEKEQINLAFASGDLPDLILGSDGKLLSLAEVQKYGNEGLILDLAPYMTEEYMPLATAAYEQLPDYKKILTNPDGEIFTLTRLVAPTDPANHGRAFINYDWMEELGYEAPTTLDEFTELMRAFKEMGDDIIPIGGTYETANPMRYILNAFGFINKVNHDNGLYIGLRNGEVVLPVADREGYAAVLTYMNMLYEEGLIHPDFFTMDKETFSAIAAAGRNGFLCEAPFVYVGDDYKEWWGAYPLTSDWNDTAQYAAFQQSLNVVPGAVVTTACDDIPLALAFLDYVMYMDGGESPDDAAICEFRYGPREGDGLETLAGKTWNTWREENYAIVMDDMGEWGTQWDYMTNEIWLWNMNCTINNLNSTLAENCIPGLADVYTGIVEEYRDSENPALARKGDWISGDHHYRGSNYATANPYLTEEVIPQVIYFDEETQERVDELYVAIKEYAMAETAKFVTGQRSLDELDAYFDQIEALGAKEYVQYYADYYADFLAQ